MDTNAIVGWGGAALLMAIAFLMTLIVPSHEVHELLVGAVTQARPLAIVMHVVVLVGIVGGLAFRKMRDHIFAFPSSPRWRSRRPAPR